MSAIKKQIVLKVSELQPLRRLRLRRDIFSRNFNYNLDFANLNFKKEPSFYRVGTEETGIHVVEPYASLILKQFAVDTLGETKKTVIHVEHLFKTFKEENDFIGMDMARKYLQLGAKTSQIRGFEKDRTARVECFSNALEKIESNEFYLNARIQWKDLLG